MFTLSRTGGAPGSNRAILESRRAMLGVLAGEAAAEDGSHRFGERLDLGAEGDFEVGAELVRLHSQTVYYVLGRIKGAIKVLLSRRRAAS